METRKAHAPTERHRSLEGRFILAREADYHIARHRKVGDAGAGAGHNRFELGAGVATVHAPEHLIVAGLQRHMQMRTDCGFGPHDI
ncbi:MAG: hypothetical protein BWX86_02833 [Verrucomicrobia bacterium ADurb.Bin122]|nr:MAG: hypothetical protein BWX86_02833 [Verrucomicrobia bacterium ADurb.Bin122]